MSVTSLSGRRGGLRCSLNEKAETSSIGSLSACRGGRVVGRKPMFLMRYVESERGIN